MQIEDDVEARAEELRDHLLRMTFQFGTLRGRCRNEDGRVGRQPHEVKARAAEGGSFRLAHLVGRPGERRPDVARGEGALDDLRPVEKVVNADAAA